MALTSSEQAKAKIDLKAKGCTDSDIAAVLALPQATGPFLTILLQLLSQYGPGILALLLQLLNPQPTPPTP